MNRVYQKEGEVENTDRKETESRATNFLKEAKLYLPSTRKRLKGIRECKEERILTDPEDMGKIIKKFWGGDVEEVRG